jgi:hypothetical protein
MVFFITTLISWEIWKERNERIFQNHASMETTIIMKDKYKARACRLAVEKVLSRIMPGESAPM